LTIALHFYSILSLNSMVVPANGDIIDFFCGTGGGSFREVALLFCCHHEPLADGAVVAMIACEVRHCGLYRCRSSLKPLNGWK